MNDKVSPLSHLGSEPAQYAALQRELQATRQRLEATEAALRRSEARASRQQTELEWIYQSAPLGLALINRDLRWVRINTRLADIDGLPVATYLGRSLREVLPDLADTLEPLCRRVLETGEPVLEVEVHGSTPREPGVERDWRASYVPVRGPDGAVLGIGCVVEEITERKRLEQLKRELVSTVSHELRTPLTSIVGALGLVHGGVTGELPPQAKRMCAIAHRNAERLVALVNDLLDLDRLASGQMPFTLGPVALHPLIEEGIGALQPYAERYGVRLTVQLDATGTEVHADPDRLVQVLSNLVSNAVKFSPPGETVTIAVSTHAGVARVAVSDRGPGIPEAFRARIFEKFAQADTSESRAKGGTGLGLSICKAIMDRLGGRIGFESEVGRGTTFWLELPAIGEGMR
jgi:PAS domain S-box-containing protein